MGGQEEHTGTAEPPVPEGNPGGAEGKKRRLVVAWRKNADPEPDGGADKGLQRPV